MDTTLITAPLPSVASSVDDILASIVALSLSADDAQRLITAIHSSALPSGAEDDSTSTADAPLVTSAPPAVPGGSGTPASPPVTSIPAASLVASAAVATTAPVAVPGPAVAPVAPTAADAAAPVIVPAVDTAPVAPVAPVIAPAIVPAPAAPVIVPAAPVLPPPAQPANLIVPAIPAAHLTRSRRGVLYLVPLQDVPGPYYIVTKGKSIGVIADWNRTSPLVTGVKGAVFRKVVSVDQGIQAIMSAIDDNIVEYL